MSDDVLLAAARGGDAGAFDELVGPLRQGLLLHCYRMLASSHDAEDAVQEALVRAWRGLDRFFGDSSLRTWVYTIATNVCLREIERRGRRVLPVDLQDASVLGGVAGPPMTEIAWLGPLPGAGITWEATPTEAVYDQREAVELAFIAALQHLPALQRAVLIMRDVLAFPAADVAEALVTTVPAVNSALQRARATMGAKLPERSQQQTVRELGDAHVRTVVDAFVRAWDASDVDALVAVLAEDVTLAMPPFGAWFAGRDAVLDFLGRGPLGDGRRWSSRISTANGQVSVEQFMWDEKIGAFLAHCVSVLTLGPDGITAIDSYLYPELVGAA